MTLKVGHVSDEKSSKCLAECNNLYFFKALLKIIIWKWKFCDPKWPLVTLTFCQGYIAFEDAFMIYH